MGTGTRGGGRFSPQLVGIFPGFLTSVRVARPVVSTVPLMFNAGRRTIDFRLVFRILGFTAEGQVAASR